MGTVKDDRFLVISDLQIPFEADKALDFCRYLKKHFKIPKENILNVGDELDLYYGSLYKKSIRANHTATSELESSRKTIRRWGSHFPLMKLAESNHGMRWVRKAEDCEIPSQLLRSYKEIIQAPEGWEWKKHWVFDKIKHPFLLEHGDDWGGQNPAKDAALHNGISTCMGHHHTKAMITHFRTAHQKRLWGAVIGSLIDSDQYAFEYARKGKLKAVLGCLVILNSGSTPVWVPYE